MVFDWGDIAYNQWFLSVVRKEIFQDNIYQKFYSVKEGDVVVDIGASVGPFIHSILKQNPIAYCIEPSPSLFKTLEKNLGGKATLINAAIAAIDGKFETDKLFNPNSTTTGVPTVVNGITWKTFIEQNNISKIDLIKTDCEGGEYDIFNAENLDWIRKNVRHVAGEFHLQKESFRTFRDLYLREFKHEVWSADLVNIRWDLWNDHFLEFYKCINLYMEINP